jgi:hypothetical protein
MAMKSETSIQVRTVGDLCRDFAEPIHRIHYAILSRRIEPVGRIGLRRTFDQAGIDAIRRALAQDRRRERRASVER